MGDDDQREDEPAPITRRELGEALRFVHTMATQSQAELDRVDTMLAAVVRVLVESGKLDPRKMDALLPQVAAQLRERASYQVSVDVGPSVDKYAVEGPEDLDCLALLPICLGRCCRLTFSLSFQDLEEGEVLWNYALPYRIRQGADGYCVHADRSSHGCTVYEHRPATCRKYDCRQDERIWQDFERRIPAPLERTDGAHEQLYKIRRIGDRVERMDEE